MRRLSSARVAVRLCARHWNKTGSTSTACTGTEASSLATAAVVWERYDPPVLSRYSLQAFGLSEAAVDRGFRPYIKHFRL